MFQAKAVYNTGVEEISMPENWHELKFKNYVELVNIDPELKDEKLGYKRISILTGIPEDDVQYLPTAVFIRLITASQFLNNMDPLIQALNVPEKYKNFKVGGIEIGTFILAQQELQRVKDSSLDTVNAGQKIVYLFTKKRGRDYDIPGWNISNEPVTEVLGLVNFFLNKLESS